MTRSTTDQSSRRDTIRPVILVGLPLLLGALAPLFGIIPEVRFSTVFLGGLLFGVLAIGVHALVSKRPRHTSGSWKFPSEGGSIGSQLVSELLTERRYWVRGAVLMMAALFLLDVYSNFKQAIPEFASYSWDPAFRQLDRALHFGSEPWLILTPVLQNACGMNVLDWAYQAWYPVTLGTVAVSAWNRDPDLRFRALLTFHFTWIVGGIVLATVFASGGPVYFDRFVPGPSDPYAELVQRLYELDLLAVRGQAMLWNGFSNGGDPWVSGISAMPSLHVAMATFAVLLAREHGPRWTLLATLYGLLIMVGSVALGWHYAIDGYAGALLVALLWWLAGRLAARTSAPDPDASTYASAHQIGPEHQDSGQPSRFETSPDSLGLTR